MLLVTEACVIAALSVIFMQDILTRAVHWFLFPVLISGLTAIRFLRHEEIATYMDSLTKNLGFLLLQLLMLTAFFSIKYKKVVNITHGLLHWGDILMLASLCFYLSYLSYIAFYVISLPVCLMVWHLKQYIRKKNTEHIPLAGLQALLFMIILVSDLAYFHINLTSNNWIERQLLWM